MQTLATNMQSICIGRLIVSLPNIIKQERADYLFREREKTDLESIALVINNENSDARSLSAWRHQKESEIKTQQRSLSKDGGSMLAESREIKSNVYLLRIYANDAVTSSFITTVYALIGSVSLSVETKSFNDNYPKAETRLLEFLSRLSPRPPTSTEQGFCIGSLLVKGTPFEIQSADVNFSIPSHPDITIEFDTYSGITPESERLEARRHEGMSIFQRLGMSSEVKTLHSGNRAAGEFEGYELLLYFDTPDEKSHLFEWQYPGGVDRHTQPTIDVIMKTGQQFNPLRDHPPSLTDAEARSLWDSIINSIRIRPNSI